MILIFDFNDFNNDFNENFKNENFEFDIIKKINYNKINRFCIPAIIGQQKNSFVCYDSNDFNKRNLGEMEIEIDELNIKNENYNKNNEKNNLSLIVRKENKKNDDGNYKKNNNNKKNVININNNNNEEKKVENNKKKGILFTDLY